MEVKDSFSFITFLKAFTPTSASILLHLFSKTIYLSARYSHEQLERYI